MLLSCYFSSSQQSSDNDLSSEKSDLPSASSDKPKPAPRKLTREEITQENQDSESDSDTATDSVQNTSNPDNLADPKQEPNPPVVAPQAVTRSVKSQSSEENANEVCLNSNRPIRNGE